MPHVASPPPSDPALAAPAGAVLPAITLRSCAAGFLLSLMFALVTPYNDNVAHGNYFIGNGLPLALVFSLAVINVVVNPLLGRHRLRAAEMAVAVGMALVACAFPSSGLYREFTPLLADTVFLIHSNPWLKPLVHAMPAALVPSKNPDSRVIRDFFLGVPAHTHRSLWWTVKPWAHVFFAWAFFLLPVYGAILLFCALMRKQWVEKERLAFPLAVIPLHMVADPPPGSRWNSLWKSRLLWLGAAIPVCIHLNNGAALFYPSLPLVPIQFHLASTFTQYPWNQLPWGMQSNQIYFTYIGATYFVPLDVSFSLWFMYLAYSVLLAFYTTDSAAAGVDMAYQSIGMVWAYGLILLYLARQHLWNVITSMGKPREPNEFLSSRANVIALCGCLAVASGFYAYSFGNIFNPLNLGLGLLLVLLILFYGMVITRMAIEAGLLICQTPSEIEPFQSLAMLLNNNASLLTLRQWMVGLVSTQTLLNDQREFLMPLAADALQLGAGVRLRRKPLYVLLLAAAMLLSLVCSGALHHILSYEYGRQTFDDGWGPVAFPLKSMALMQAMQSPAQPYHGAQAWGFLLCGAAAVTALFLGRWFFAGFPLNPLGLLLLNTFAIGVSWYSVMISCVAKWAIMRWGGSRLYEKAKPFFIGLILGDAIAAVFWMVFGMVHPWPNINHAYLVLPH